MGETNGRARARRGRGLAPLARLRRAAPVEIARRTRGNDHDPLRPHPHARSAPCSPSPPAVRLTASTSTTPSTRRRSSPNGARTRTHAPLRRLRARSSPTTSPASARLRPARRAARHGFPAARVARDRERALRRDDHLRRARRRAGAPGSARAAGAATGRNPLAIVVPCHRIVGSRRQPHRLRRRPRAQGEAARARRRAGGRRRLRPAGPRAPAWRSPPCGARSYLFMRLAVPHVGPAWMIEGARRSPAAWCWSRSSSSRRRASRWRAHWRGYLVVGVVGVARPLLAHRHGAEDDRRVHRRDPQRDLAALRARSSPRSGSASGSRSRRSRASRCASRASRCWWAGRRRR